MATFPDPLIIDAEMGAGSAVDSERRLIVPLDSDTLAVTRKIINDLLHCEYKDRRIHYKKQGGEELLIGSVILDTIDGIQQPLKYKLLAGRDKMQRDDWGRLLDKIMPLIFEMKKLPVFVLIGSHSKVVDPAQEQAGSRGFAAQGALADQMPRWFDHIIHLIATDDSRRLAFVQPTIYQKYRVIAKDRHGVFFQANKPNQFEVPAKKGFPSDEIAKIVDAAYEF
jgi:hypothetical protein